MIRVKKTYPHIIIKGDFEIFYFEEFPCDFFGKKNMCFYEYV